MLFTDIPFTKMSGGEKNEIEKNFSIEYLIYKVM